MRREKRRDALRHGRSRTHDLAAACAVAAALAVLPGPAGADAPASERAWLSIGALGGVTLFDSHLADYQWDTSPQNAWGAQVLAGRGRFAAGVRTWRTQTTQALGLQDVASDPVVRSSRWELVGRARVARAGATDLLVTTGAGRLFVRYSPERVESDPYQTGTPIVIELAPIAAWVGGFGVAARRPLGPRFGVGAEIEQRFFGWDAAYRSGGTIVNRRERFGEWSARLELSWTHTRG